MCQSLGQSGAVIGVLRDDWAGEWQNFMSGELLFWRQGSCHQSLSSLVGKWTWNPALAGKQIPLSYYKASALTFPTLKTVFGVNSSEFCSETLAAASFCILSVLVLFAQLIQSDIPKLVLHGAGVLKCGFFYTCFYPQSDCCSAPVPRPWPPFKKVNFLRGCAHPLNCFVDQLLLLQLKHTCTCTYQNTESCSELLHRLGDLDCSLLELIHLFC